MDDPELLAIEGFEIVQITHSSDLSIPEEDKAKSTEIAEIPNALTTKVQPTSTVGPSETALLGVGLHDSILEDYSLSCKAFSSILYPIDAIKDVEEKMTSVQGDMGARIEVAVVRAIKKFWTSKEYEDEQDRFVVNAYNKERHSVRCEDVP
ncbi:hypothetical protein COCNU_scaffold039075G000010 [Cocos nucifera]|nr:hypothetical protein [Cocos nucifera]